MFLFLVPLVLTYNFLPPLYESVKNSVVEISVRLTDLGGVRGSGVLIDPPGYVLTAAHVVSSLQKVQTASGVKEVKPTVKVRLYDRTVTVCSVRMVDSNRDLALLYCSSLSTYRYFSRVFSGDIATGADIAIVAAPRGLTSFAVAGKVAKLIPDKGKILLNATSGPGASGGPVFNEYGEIVGIVQFGIVSPFELFGNVIGAASPLQIRKFLKEANL